MRELSLGVLSTLILSGSVFGATLAKELENSSLVVYNSSIGLVHEERLLDVKKDDTSIVYEGVADTIDTDSVNLRLNPSIKLNSQQFRFDKLTQTKLLDAHIGKELEVKIEQDKNSFEIIKVTLLSSSSKTALVKMQNSKIISVNIEDIIFKDIPKELITKPSLVWNIQTDKDSKSNLEIDYLIKNISWKSDYILNLTQDEATLSAWMSIDNRSGKAFNNTQLNVLAGDINLQREDVYAREMLYSKVVTAPAAVAHQSHEGYHIYSVPFKVNLANNEKTQIKFIDKPNIKIQRSYSSRVSNPLYANGQSKFDVTQYVDIEGLELALPKGVVRTYSKMGEVNILLAQTNIQHTPKNTPIKLKIGTNFDIKVTQTVLEKADDKYRYNTTLEYEVKNASDEEKTVRLEMPFNAHKDSKIKTKSSYTLEKGNLVVFKVKVPAQGSKKIRANFISKR